MRSARFIFPLRGRTTAIAVRRGPAAVAGETPPAFAPKGAILKSHGEMIAGLSRSLKDGPPGRRRAAGLQGQSLTDLDRPARCSLQEI